jgi:putative transposase
LVRLVGAVLAEQHDEWTEQRHYLGLDILAKSRLTKITNSNPTDQDGATLALLYPAMTSFASLRVRMSPNL